MIAGSIIAQLLTGPVVSLIKKQDLRLQRYEQYREATKAFEARLKEAEARLKEAEARLKEAEECERRRQAAFWQSLSGHRFEHELATLFEQAGYSVQRTRGSGDGGIDIVLRLAGKTIIVQCEQNKHPVAPAVARELYGTLIASKADHGILAVTGGVTPGVHEFFADKPLRIMGLREIISLHQALIGKKATEGV
jgi:restriction endonuclease Mrr